MRVLALVTDAFGGHGGIALYNRNVLTALCRHPRHPEVVAIPRLIPHPLEPLPHNLDFRVQAQGGKLRYCVEAARVLVENHRFDLIVCSHVNLLPIAEPARRLSGAPLLLFTYGVEAWTPRGRLLNTLLRRIDAHVSIRQHTLDSLNGWAGLQHVPSFVLENAIHLDRYGCGERRADLVERYGLKDKTVLMTLGRIEDPRFGMDEIIEVMPQLLQARPELMYLCVGGGHHQPRLERKAQALGVGDQVVFSGPVDEADKADHYRLADAFAMPGSHPTEYDRYPLRFVFLEAMACGLPVVASRPEELTNPKDSPIPNIYVDPCNQQELIDGLLQALDQGPGPVPEALTHYSFDHFCKRLHAIVDELAAPSVSKAA